MLNNVGFRSVLEMSNMKRETNNVISISSSLTCVFLMIWSEHFRIMTFLRKKMRRFIHENSLCIGKLPTNTPVTKSRRHLLESVAQKIHHIQYLSHGKTLLLSIE